MDPPSNPVLDEEWADPEPLHTAAREGDLDAVRRLVAEGWDVNSFADHLPWTPLHLAARAGRLDVVAFLVAAGANVNARDESRIGETPLGEVAGDCSSAMARVLVDAGANPTIRGWMWRTALDRSADRKDRDGRRVHDFLKRAARRFGQIPSSRINPQGSHVGRRRKQPHVGKRRRRR